MIRAYVVTEGASDATLLKVLLPEKVVKEIEFFDGGGSSAARSAARTLLVARRRPVALVADADTNDSATVRERYLTLYELLDMASPGIRFEVFLAVPEIEALLVQDREILEKLLTAQLSDADIETAKAQPGRFLKDKLGADYARLAALVANLDVEEISMLRQHSLVRKLARFLWREIMVSWLLENVEAPLPPEEYILREQLERHFPDAAPEAIDGALELLERERNPE